MSKRMHVVCKDCGKHFSISEEEQKWLKEKGLQPFKRCRECRKSRKSRRQQKENK